MKRVLWLLICCFSAAANAESLETVLADAQRLPADIERDQRSRPQDVLPLLALETGNRVADIFGGGGYYSEILARVVGTDGEVILQNNDAYRQFARKGLALRFNDRDPGAITLLDSEVDDLKLGQERLDAALIVLSYHDLFYDDAEQGWPQIDEPHFIGQIHSALKPGGRFLIVDHAARAGSGTADSKTLHRIDEAFAIKRLSSQGFRLLGSTDALRNGDDPHTQSVFDPEIRGMTDRFVLVFERQ